MKTRSGIWLVAVLQIVNALAPAATDLSYEVAPPIANGGTAWKGIMSRVSTLVADMTLEEKARVSKL